MIRIFHNKRILACVFLAGVCLGSVSCERKNIRPASEEALRVANPALYAELKKHRYAPEAEEGFSSEVVVPPGTVEPELYPLTERIHKLITAAGQPSSPENYVLAPSSLNGASLTMVYLPGGNFVMGSPASEAGRKEDENPQRKVEVSPFWISSIEIPWEFYQSFMDNGRPRSKDGRPLEPGFADELQDDVSQPTAPYTAMNLGMGNGYEKGFPAIAMSHYAASKFCEWLSAQTGEYYRLPTEAEWEYACRAGSDTAYCFGNDEGGLEEYAWFYDNGQDQYQRTATRKPNAWGLHDMHGNVAEWVVDTYAPYTGASTEEKDPVHISSAEPQLVRGGSWDDDPPALRSAARRASSPEWNTQDPQNPKSIWYLTNGGMVGFRIVRPWTLPSVEAMHLYWNASKGK